jgi:hypothetical protein
MVVLAFPPVVPENTYRIRSCDRVLYLEWQSDNEVKPVALKPDSDLQKWTVTSQLDDLYIITNVASKTTLSTTSYDHEGKQMSRLYSGGTQYWTLEPRGDDFIIGHPSNSLCVDLSNDNWAILWERNGGRNQRWVLDSVEPNSKPGGNPGIDSTGNAGSTGSSNLISSGVYNIKNRATDGEICIWTGYVSDNAPVLVWPATGTARTYSARAWNVSPTSGGVQITNSYYVAKGPRSLKEGPFVNQASNTCRLIPVEGTQYFHIATGPASDSRVLMDSNAPRAINQPATMSQYNKDDQRQHWMFSPAH